MVMEKNFFKFCNVLLSTLWIGRGPLYEQTWIPVTQECFLPSLVKLAQWFWRRSSFGKGRRTSFEQTRFPLIFFFLLYAKFGWNWFSCSGEDENVKSLQTDGWTNFAWIREFFVFIRKKFAFIRENFAFICESFALICGDFA